MVAIPRWLQGRHLTAVTITPQTVAADGTLTDGAAKALVALVTKIEMIATPSHDNINAVNTTLANNVIEEDNTGIEVEILMQSNAAAALGTNVLGDLIVASDVFKAVFTRGAGLTGNKTWTYYGTRGRFREGVDSKGRNTASLELLQVDTGATTNPAYST